MWLIPKDDSSLDTTRYLLDLAIQASRFTARIEIGKLRYKAGIKISVVRLRNRKDYCGAHAGPCPVVGGRKHMIARYLEGLDWVGFNHLLNDVLDAHNLSYDVFSFNRESLVRQYYIRRGRQRRIAYVYDHNGRFAHWTQGTDECFADYCGKPSPDYDPEILASGTPGLACYSLEDETKLTQEQLCHQS
jgi:hypothetical protein